MRKSYTIALIKPFRTNTRAEIIKMPKVYFFDLGLRNVVLNNFENISERLDKGQVFENIVWREFAFKYNMFDEIKYRRTQQQNEIDFIIQEKNAYEAKFSKELIRESKYKLFREKYPNIPLEFITFDEVIEKIAMK
jgi:predicted AAA+ superfamily ATPase